MNDQEIPSSSGGGGEGSSGVSSEATRIENTPQPQLTQFPVNQQTQTHMNSDNMADAVSTEPAGNAPSGTSLPSKKADVAGNVQKTFTLPQPNGNSAAAAIEIIDLCKKYGTFQAVDHLNLTIQQGEIFGLLGPNGSGKTTTINMISGLSPQTSGEIRMMGLSIKKKSRQVHKILGFVPQETALYEELSAYRNLDFHADLYGLSRKEKKQRINEMLKMVQLDSRMDSLVNTFSGGMKRRLAIARALLHDPKLIYLDEPTIGVDVQARRAIWGYIHTLRAQGKTVLITTNYLEEAKALCDRVAIIDHGKLVIQDSPKHLEQMYGGDVIVVDTDTQIHKLDNIKTLEGVTSVTQDANRLTIAAANAAGLVAPIVTMLHWEGRVKKIEIREPDLDDIFIQLTGATLRD